MGRAGRDRNYTVTVIDHQIRFRHSHLYANSLEDYVRSVLQVTESWDGPGNEATQP